MNVDFPYHFSSEGRTAGTDDVGHVRDLIQQVLFTTPGERVNRPTFGSGLMQLVFAPNSGQLAAATQALVQGALQEWLGDVIEVRRVEIDSHDASFGVTVEYVIRRTGTAQTAEFTQGGIS